MQTTFFDMKNWLLVAQVPVYFMNFFCYIFFNVNIMQDMHSLLFNNKAK